MTLPAPKGLGFSWWCRRPVLHELRARWQTEARHLLAQQQQARHPPPLAVELRPWDEVVMIWRSDKAQARRAIERMLAIRG